MNVLYMLETHELGWNRKDMNIYQYQLAITRSLIESSHHVLICLSSM